MAPKDRRLRTSVDIDRPSTWIPFTSPKLCEGCYAGCCTLPVEVSPFDLIRLELTDEDEAGQSLKKVAKRLKKEGFVRDFRATTQLFILEQHADRGCIFLDENRRCTVYEKRPEVCRRFPKIGPRPGFCPKQGMAKKPES